MAHEMTMTTDAATTRLARIYVGGDDDQPGSRVEAALGAARRAGQDWRWDAAEAAIARAYRLLGAEPPAARGYDWHCGEHPLARAIHAERQRIYGRPVEH